MLISLILGCAYCILLMVRLVASYPLFPVSASVATGPKSREMADKARSARTGVSEDPDNSHAFVMPLIAPQVTEGPPP